MNPTAIRRILDDAMSYAYEACRAGENLPPMVTATQPYLERVMAAVGVEQVVTVEIQDGLTADDIERIVRRGISSNNGIGRRT